MYKERKVSLILPTYREKDSIRQVIQDFEALGVVDEILVINNNAIAGTSDEVRQTSAIEIHELVQGYGAAIRRGFTEATGDLIVVCEPDGTFAASDLHKFLAYADDVDIVYGSRTIRTFIWQRANMGFLLKWGNWFVAKLLEVLFNTTYLSDVGCTYRMIRREALTRLLPAFRVNSNFFGPEMMVRGYRMKLKCVQIPVNYKERTGESSVTGNLNKTIVLGAQMTLLIIAMRFRLERWLLPLLDKPITPRKVTGVLLGLGILAGLALRWPMLFYMGVFDMDVYYEWGRKALEVGMIKSYHGIYFPLQYQIFEFCAWATGKLHAPFFTIYKLPNLICDLASFCLLLFLLKRQGRNPLYALVYWLHPWFLTIFSLGYIDFQFTFCVLLCVWLLRGETTRDYLLAGVPLALAFLMKPQALILIVATFAYGVSRYLRTRDQRPLFMLAPATLLFLQYEIWFTLKLPHPRYIVAQVLPGSYLNVTNIMPALTALMANVWYPVAYFLRKRGEGIPTVSDRIHVLPYVPAKYLAAAVVLGLVGLHVFRVEREAGTSPSDKFIKIFGFAALAVPMLMTSAHENHLFLASVFLMLLMAQPLPSRVKLSIQVLLLVQLLNLFSLYGSHPHRLAEFFKRTQSPEIALVYAIISVVCAWFIARSLWSPPVVATESREQ